MRRLNGSIVAGENFLSGVCSRQVLQDQVIDEEKAKQTYQHTDRPAHRHVLEIVARTDATACSQSLFGMQSNSRSVDAHRLTDAHRGTYAPR